MSDADRVADTGPDQARVYAFRAVGGKGIAGRVGHKVRLIFWGDAGGGRSMVKPSYGTKPSKQAGVQQRARLKARPLGSLRDATVTRRGELVAWEQDCNTLSQVSDLHLCLCNPTGVPIQY